ncbi:uncharacterized protein LOC115280740 [Suricata suricatta]|uniref:uncharacterized protein LOC115280740 n=1 Tax=Suricata suricatta TaxID=37032 RepID=UPI0011558AB5|nr:uncharacterized protein LOC115280740 [Suricata suricatta]
MGGSGRPGRLPPAPAPPPPQPLSRGFGVAPSPGSGGVGRLPRTVLWAAGKGYRSLRSQTPGALPAGEGAPCALGERRTRGTVTGREDAPRASAGGSIKTVCAHTRWPRGRRQGHGIQLQSHLEDSRAALMGFPEAPERLGGVGSVSAPPACERLSGGTLRFPRSGRERVVGACRRSRSVLGTQRGPEWPGPACFSGVHRPGGPLILVS